MESSEKPYYGEKYLDEIISKKKPQTREEAGTELFDRLQEFCENVVIILHSVNTNERWAVLDHMHPPELEPGKPLTGRTVDLNEPNNIVLGMFGGYRSALIQTEMGVNSRDEIVDALDEFSNAKFILAIGVAFGRDREKYKYGDVLVSKFIDGVGNIKHTCDGLILIRADRSRFTPVSDVLRNVFARSEVTWRQLVKFKCAKIDGAAEGAAENNGRYSKVHLGVIISDKSLINNEATRDKLLANAPEAIGGEMEGVTLVEIQYRLASNKKSIPRELGVIVIKGVADHADGQKDKNWQLTSAKAAASYAEHKLNETDRKLFSEHKGTPEMFCTLISLFVLFSFNFDLFLYYAFCNIFNCDE